MKTKQTEMFKVNRIDGNKVNRTIATQGLCWASWKSPIALCYLRHPLRVYTSAKQVPKYLQGLLHIRSSLWCPEGPLPPLLSSCPREGHWHHVLGQKKKKMGLGHGVTARKQACAFWDISRGCWKEKRDKLKGLLAAKMWPLDRPKGNTNYR